MTSIRRRVVAYCVVGVWLLLGVTSVIWYRQTRDVLVHWFDRSLQEQMATVASMVDNKPEGLEIDVDPEFVEAYAEGPDADFFQIWRPDGSPVGGSESLGERALPQVVGSPEEPRMWDLVLPDGRPGRACGARFMVPPDEDDDDEPALDEVDPGAVAAPAMMRGDLGSRITAGVAGNTIGLAPVGVLSDSVGSEAEVPEELLVPVDVVVAIDRTRLDYALNSQLVALVAIALGLAVGVAGVVAFVVVRGLAPLREMGREVAALDPAQLPPRLADRPLPRELQPIASRVSDLLGRVSEAMQRERRTTSNIAHELMTPIAELRALTEVAARWPEDEAYCRRAVGEAGMIAEQMQKLATTVLALARSEAGDFEVALETIDIHAHLQLASRALAERARARELDLAVEGPQRLRVCSDRAVLQVLTTNLLGNAVDHCPRGGRVRCAAVAAGSDVVLTIRNTNPGLQAEDLERMTERFWRKDTVRKDTGRGHVGLGLALARELAERASLELGFRIEHDEVVVELTLPAASASSSA